jgi:ABC-type uncharacterized transport system substrate-binding protein
MFPLRSATTFRTAGLMIALAIGLAAPLATEAQQSGKAYQIGVIVHGGSYRAAVGGLRDGLRSSGLEEGRQWVLEVRETKGDLDAVEEVARELARTSSRSPVYGRRFGYAASDACDQ